MNFIGGFNTLGRKRKTNVIRDKSGKSRGEPHEVAPEVLAVRERNLRELGVPLTFERKEQTPQGWAMIVNRTATDRLSGFTLGVLLLRHRSDPGNPGSISQVQYDAGEAWTRIVHRHAAIMGYSLTTPSPSFAMVGGGRGIGLDPEDEVVQRIRRQWRECYDALMRVSAEHNAPIWQLTYAVAVENRPTQFLSTMDYGHLRTGLNTLVRVLN